MSARGPQPSCLRSLLCCSNAAVSLPLRPSPLTPGTVSLRKPIFKSSDFWQAGTGGGKWRRSRNEKGGNDFRTTISPANGNVKGSLVSSGYGDASGGTSKRSSVCVHLRVPRQADAPEQKSKKNLCFSLLLPLRGRKWGWGGLVS